MIYEILIFILLFLSGILLIKYITKSPPKAVTENFKNSVEIKESMEKKLYYKFAYPLITLLSKFIKIESDKERILKSNIKRAGIDLTPQEYYARAIVMAAFTLPFSFLLILFGIGTLLPVTLSFTIIIYMHFITDMKEKLAKKRDLIEKGLPNFIRSILYKVGNQNENQNESQKVVKADLIKIFEDYYKVILQTKENSIFQYDIGVLIMEMKSIDIDNALRNFDERMSITHVSFLVQGLIGISRGENQVVRLETLAKDMSKLANENLKRELAKRPSKVKMAIIPLVVVAVVSLLYVIITHLVNSMGVIF